MNTNTKSDLAKLFEQWSGGKSREIENMPAHGSDRKYFRLYGSDKTAIGAHNADKAENIAFLSFSKHFFDCGLPIPEIFAVDQKNDVYLEQDLGDTTLFSYLTEMRKKEGFSDNIKNIYKKVINILPKFQIEAAKNLDYSVCYPRNSFDKQSMMWDLNYFKYYFLKLAQISFDEQKLEDDFQIFTNFLLEAGRDYFLYRDFQSRNIMLLDGNPYFIDYQGGRKGALQYDVASLLYDAKADIPKEIRAELLDEYIKAASKYIHIKRDSFLNHYYGYVYIRIMQALGAYGFRGFYERKTHFLKSVPYAIQNLEHLLHTTTLPIEIPTLRDAWSKLVRSTKLRQLADVELKLTVRIQSFSYRRGIPWDDRGHGGGFVFDCRSLPNPGRLPEFAILTGNDPETIAFLEKENDVKQYLDNVIKIIDLSIVNYQKRNFTDLMVAFGCTGGQHRSVYCSTWVHDYIKEKYAIDVEIRHRELEMK